MNFGPRAALSIRRPPEGLITQKEAAEARPASTRRWGKPVNEDGPDTDVPEDRRKIAAGRRRRWRLLGGPYPSIAALVLLLAVVGGFGIRGNIKEIATSVATAVSFNAQQSASDQVYCQENSGGASIQSNFNSQAIVAGNVLWFSAVFKISGLPVTGGTVTFTNQTISGIPGVPGTVNPPNSTITIAQGATPSAHYDPITNTWMITLPLVHAGNGLLAAVPVVDTNGAPNGRPSSGPTWSGTISSSVGATSISWQWAAAQYPSTFPHTPAGYNLIGVSPMDGFVGSDHAGTPENFKTQVIPGGTGGGGSNYTGSYSGTQTLTCIT